MRVTAGALLLLAGSRWTDAFSPGRGGRFGHRFEVERTSPLAAASINGEASALVTDDANIPSDSPESLEVNGDIAADVSQQGERTSLISDLLRTAASSDRGQFATDVEKDEVDSIISRLEDMNPIEYPTESPDIEGTWELVYSSTQLFRSSPFFMAGRAVCETEDQAKQYDWFCDMHRAALAISSIGKVRQIISSDRMTSEFEVKVGAVPFLSDFTPFTYSGGLPFTIEGAIVSSADISPSNSGEAWEIFMDTVEIKGSNLPLLRQALDAGIKLRSRDLGNFLEDNLSGYTNPRPVFETTYLDGKIRVSRDQDGKLFVYGKLSDETAPTNYDSVDSDLGVLKLLEGMNDSIFKFYI